MPDATDLIPLGKTELRISPIGVGAWAWGDRLFWGFGRGYQENDVHSAFQVSLEAGINWFDTAEVYGQGQSERILGRFLAESGAPLLIATKFFPFPWRLSKGSLLRALRGSLRRLGRAQVDLYQLHWPYPPVAIETWADALADAVQAGLAKAVGVSNYSSDQMHRAHQALEKRGIVLASNQVEYNLIKRQVEFDGTLKTCHELGISVISYSPLAQGILTGKYTLNKPAPGFRLSKYNGELLEKMQPLIRHMREIGHAHDGKTPAQVALNWLICKGTVPIPGAKNAAQAIANAGALGWRLSETEVAGLDDLSVRL